MCILGGPLREFLHLLMDSISKNNLLCGEESRRSLCHNVPALMKNSFFHIGAMISVSLIHGGPSPAFFTDAIADYILYDTIKPHINSVIVPEVQEKLRKVSNSK